MSLDRRSFVATAAALAASAAVRPTRAIASVPTFGVPGPDPLGVRADFPIVVDRTYLNSAYITPMCRPAALAGATFCNDKAYRPLLVQELLAADEAVRKQFAQLINATADEVGLLFSTAEGENVMAQGIGLTAGDNVVLSELCYPIPFILYRTLETTHGIEMRIAKHRNGVVDVSDFEPHVDRRTRLVTVAWVSHQNGFQHDMRPIVDLAHANGALCYADAIQAVGMVPVDVRATGVDALCCGTYKWLLAGFGVAPFYLRADLLDRIRVDRFGEFMVEKDLPDHHYEFKKSARRFDYCSRAFGAVHQLGAGLSYVQNVGVARIEEHTVGLAHRLYDGLSKQGHRLFTPPDNRSSIVSFYVTKPMPDVSAAFQAADVEVTVRDGYVRVAAGMFNTSDEIDRCLEVTKQLA
jgi:selenocysteine lyase/cysteine desulfurase